MAPSANVAGYCSCRKMHNWSTTLTHVRPATAPLAAAPLAAQLANGGVYPNLGRFPSRTACRL